MIEINKTEDKNGYNYKIITDDGCFNIMFGGNLDLYWSYWPKESFKNWPISKTFTISKENYFLYQKLNELYESIKEQRPFFQPEKDEEDFFFQDLKMIDSPKKANEAYEMLFQDGTIKWKSDDMLLENASAIEIQKQDDTYSITFIRGTDEADFPTYSVRFRNSGSRYEPYNCAFMNMYNGLKDYNQNYHQIHMEEYLYNKKISKIKTKKGAH